MRKPKGESVLLAKQESTPKQTNSRKETIKQITESPNQSSNKAPRIKGKKNNKKKRNKPNENTNFYSNIREKEQFLAIFQRLNNKKAKFELEFEPRTDIEIGEKEGDEPLRHRV